MIVYREGETF